MTADNHPPAVPPPYKGPVLVDPGNDRPGLHPDYGLWVANSRARTSYRPWGLPPARPAGWRHRLPPARLLLVAMALLLLLVIAALLLGLLLLSTA